MHVPDGFLNAGTAAATGALSAGAIGAALRSMRTSLADRAIPLAGLVAAFIFAAQMINFPVAAGTTGHLIGGTLAAVLLGPATGAVVLTVVVVVQAVAFADGGLTAIGINVLNLAVITTFGGYAFFRGLRRVLPATGGGVVAATGLAGGVSVLLAASGFAIQWLFGATAPIPFDTVFGAVVGVHIPIGIGEGIISAMIVGAIMAVRPDLVAGASDLGPDQVGRRRSASVRAVLVGVAIATVVTAAVVSQFAAEAPDGLERVAEDTGIAASEERHPWDSSWFADYATDGIDDPGLSLGIAGIAGVAITGATLTGIALSLRRTRRTRIEV